MEVSKFHFDLPKELIASQPLKQRSASRLLQRLTGFTIPIEDADNWLKGTVTNDSLRVDELDRAKTVTWQSNNGQKWDITYGDYQQYAGFWLPKKLTLKHEKIRLKIQLYRWYFN